MLPVRRCLRSLWGHYGWIYLEKKEVGALGFPDGGMLARYFLDDEVMMMARIVGWDLGSVCSRDLIKDQ